MVKYPDLGGAKVVDLRDVWRREASKLLIELMDHASFMGWVPSGDVDMRIINEFAAPDDDDAATRDEVT